MSDKTKAQPQAKGFDEPVEDAEAPRREASARVEPPNFRPITPKDEDPNPTFIKLPKTPQEVGKEGNALAQAESAATGGVVSPDREAEPTGKRLWATDADFNVNLRNNPLGTANDFVEGSNVRLTANQPPVHSEEGR